jgi:hypothetical protein
LPTHGELPRFRRDWQSLRAEQKSAFLAALRLFVAGPNDQSFDPRLRVKRVQGHIGVWEMSWAPDGRATFQYGEQMIAGEAHVIWRRIGTHDVFRAPRTRSASELIHLASSSQTLPFRAKEGRGQRLVA